MSIGVENLRLHFAIGKTSAAVNDAIGQRGFAVIDVGDDREIAYVLHADMKKGAAAPFRNL